MALLVLEVAKSILAIVAVCEYGDPLIAAILIRNLNREAFLFGKTVNFNYEWLHVAEPQRCLDH